tara:strand:- start:1510 stop:1911 length:402 start_codon:yes stop_codon:yes gene_type:complete
MFKKSILSTSLIIASLLSATAFASNSQSGVISEIRYNTPTDKINASIVVVLEDDQSGYHNTNSSMSCYADGVEGWYINLLSNPLVTERTIERLEQAERDGTPVRFFGDSKACDSGKAQFNDTIFETYFYKPLP